MNPEGSLRAGLFRWLTQSPVPVPLTEIRCRRVESPAENE